MTQEIGETIECPNLLSGVALSRLVDSWDCNLGPDNIFSVAAVKLWMDIARVVVEGFCFTWCKWLPSQCNIFMWRVVYDRISTKVALRRRNIHVVDEKCVFCDEDEETKNHIFSAYSFIVGVWQGISNWCGTPQIFVFSARDIPELHKFFGGSSVKIKVFYGIAIITCWRIWKARNERVFSNRCLNVLEIVSGVKALGFLWYRNRFKVGSADWAGLCKFDLM
ncbi:putative reverse transcriptase zinc-binding domain-containing protein [Helianthus anomalus]